MNDTDTGAGVDDGGRLGQLARRLHMTEGQLYTVALVLIGVLLLLSSGLPGSGEAPAPRPGETITSEAP